MGGAGSVVPDVGEFRRIASVLCRQVEQADVASSGYLVHILGPARVCLLWSLVLTFLDGSCLLAVKSGKSGKSGEFGESGNLSSLRWGGTIPGSSGGTLGLPTSSMSLR